MKTLVVHSIGHIADELRTSVTSVKRIVARLKLQPVEVRDGVPHYDGEQYEQIENTLRKEQ